jgi:hypothetical protein
MSVARPFFPPFIDSTILATFRSCPQKFFRQYVEHWKPKGASVHLVAGGAFAKGIEVARRAFFEGVAVTPHFEGGGLKWKEEAAGLEMKAEIAQELGLSALLAAYGTFECPPDSAKSPERVAGALEFYLNHYPLGADGLTPIRTPAGRSGIEFSFAEPLDILHPTHGQPILYVGRADLVGEYGNAGVFVTDEKTTSQLGASWGKQWDMRSQFTGYVWACRRSGIKAKGALVRGVSILKTKYDTQQVLTYRPEWEVDRWEEQTIRDVQRMIRMWEEGYWDYDLDHACNEYGGCSFRANVCKSKDPEQWLPMYFEKKVWDPLARAEVGVEEFYKEWGAV